MGFWYIRIFIFKFTIGLKDFQEFQMQILLRNKLIIELSQTV